MTSDLDSLASIGIDDGRYASLGLADITDEKGRRPWDKLEFIGQMGQLQQVTVDRLGENCLNCCLAKIY
jgi:hypothetical protein